MKQRTRQLNKLMKRRAPRLVITLGTLLALALSQCFTMRHSDRTVNIPDHQADFYANNPIKAKVTKKFEYSYREFYLAWGLYRLGHLPQYRNPVSSPRANYLKDIHEIEQGKVYVNVEFESRHNFLDILITGIGSIALIPVGAPVSRTVTVRGERVLETGQ